MWKINKSNIAVEHENNFTTSCTPLTAIYSIVLRVLIHSHNLSSGIIVIKKENREETHSLCYCYLLTI